MTSKQSDDSGAGVELLTDPQGAALLHEGMTRFLERQKADPKFPKPIWLGPRGKRHVRSELLAYALSLRDRPADPKPTSEAVRVDGKTRRAAERLGCRLVADMPPAELAAWTAAGRPQRVQLGAYELVPLKALAMLAAA